ncbi:MAG: Potassium channel [Thelocarpon superellum]|nr:MAG: Potassium channel [Thelocarpon superellum]
MDLSKEKANGVLSPAGLTHTDTNDELSLQRTLTGEHHLWKIHFRPDDDTDPQDWWFASTAIPLLAATIGPLANTLSIAALVTSWRQNLPDDGTGSDVAGHGYADPHWCVALNAASLACGFAGNLALLLNFTQRIRYIIALPMTIILWYAATGILIGITVAMDRYVPPVRPQQTYSQGFWYAIIAAVLYLINSMSLMVNMLGYFLGHYPQHFTLTDHQRTLILQTMMFFIWLAGGAAVFSSTAGWSFVDCLYFCDVTILTVGFGDFAPPNDVSRGIVFPFTVGGIIMLGLMVSSINKFTSELSRENIINKHAQRQRQRTISLSRSQSRSTETADEPGRVDPFLNMPRPVVSAPMERPNRTLQFDADEKQHPKHRHRRRAEQTEQAEGLERGRHAKHHDHDHEEHHGRGKDDHEHDYDDKEHHRKDHHRKDHDDHDDHEQHKHREHHGNGHHSVPGAKIVRRMTARTKRSHELVLEEEKARFDAMRAIQHETMQFRRWYKLGISVTAFSSLWLLGAVVFWRAEAREQDLSYFEALYFCYVSLLTIGYGDLSPRSNAGKPFFVVWSLLAVPTMTILVGDLSDTVVAGFKQGTVVLGDWTILPKSGLWNRLLTRLGLLKWVEETAKKRAAANRVASGFQLAREEDIPPTIEQLAQGEPTMHDIARRLPLAIRRVADQLNDDPPRRYSYEEWAEYTRLIRFSSETKSEVARDEESEGLINWDWIGDDSPLMSSSSETEWILDRLCESMNRYMNKLTRLHNLRERQFRHHREKYHKDLEINDRGDVVPHKEPEPPAIQASPPDGVHATDHAFATPKSDPSTPPRDQPDETEHTEESGGGMVS